jgi:hypothetical protein
MNAVPLTKTIVTFLLSVLSGSGHRAGNAELKYIPTSETQGVYNVAYDNEAGSRFVLEIEDQDGDRLYQNIFSDKLFNKNFQLADPESYTKLVFIIRNLGDHSLQRWEVEARTHLVEEVKVDEIK